MNLDEVKFFSSFFFIFFPWLALKPSRFLFFSLIGFQAEPDTTCEMFDITRFEPWPLLSPITGCPTFHGSLCDQLRFLGRRPFQQRNKTMGLIYLFIYFLFCFLFCFFTFLSFVFLLCKKIRPSSLTSPLISSYFVLLNRSCVRWLLLARCCL